MDGKGQADLFNSMEISDMVIAGETSLDKDLWKKARRTFVGVDIGGTKTLYELFGVIDDSTFVTIGKVKFDSRKITDFAEPTSLFLQYLRENVPDKLVPNDMTFVAAGPVKDGYCKLTNHPGSIDARGIEKSIATLQLNAAVVNDFIGVDYGVIALKEGTYVVKKPFHSLTGGRLEGKPNGTIGVIGAGTGLGKGFITYEKAEKGITPVAHPSEGDNNLFVPVSKIERDLQEFLMENYTNNFAPRWEDAVSGQGLARIFKLMYSLHPVRKGNEGKRLDEIRELCEAKTLDDVKINIGIAKLAEDYPHNEAVWETYKTFITAYARAAQQLALEVMSDGGVYVAGGIAPKMLPMFRRHDFVNTFRRHRTHHGVLSDMPIKIVLEEQVGVIGAGYTNYRPEIFDRVR